MTNTITLPLLPANYTGSNAAGVLQSLELRRTIERMAARRAAITGSCDWPDGNHNWLLKPPPAPSSDKRKITAISFTLSASTATITVDGPNLYGGTDDVSGNSYADPWLGTIAHSPDTDFIPTSWTFVCDDPLYGWSRCIKSAVISWTNARVFTVDAKPIRDAIKALQIPSAAYMVGWFAVVIRSNGLWRSDRVIEFPNDRELATGIVQSLAAVTGTAALPASPAPNIIRDPKTNWTSSNGVDLRGCDFLTYTTAGDLERATISASSTASIGYLSGATWTASINSPYLVVTNGARCIPGKKPMYPWFVYRGVVEDFDTWDFRQDAVNAANMPVKTVKIPTKVGDDCQDVPFPAFGVDQRTTYDGSDGIDSYTDCGRPYERIYAPDLFKSWAGLQFDALNRSTRFVEDRDWTGVGTIPNLNPAETARVGNALLTAAGVPATLVTYTATTGNVAGSSGDDGTYNDTIAISGASLPRYPINVWYSIHQANGDYNFGYGYMPDANTLISGEVVPDFGPFHQASYHSDTGVTDSNDSGRTVLLWPGFTKITFNEFRSMHDQPGLFKPDIITPDVGLPYAQDPPAPVNFTNTGSIGVGAFIKEYRSTNCWDRSVYAADPQTVQGFAREGTATNTAFVSGRVYRWTGDAYWHPSINYGGFAQGDILSPYLGKGFVGRCSDAHQSQRNALMGGTISAGGSFWCRVPTCDFFSDPVTGGVLYTATGTATSGSTTGLTDSTFANSTHATSGYLAASRFPGFGGSYVSFPIEVDQGSGTYRGTFDPQYTEARLIATGSTNGAFTWTDALSATANGKPWRIREPHLLHPVYGRTMTLSPGTNSGTKFTATNIGTCGDIQFFSGAGTNTVTPGWLMSIDNPLPGGVYRYQGTATNTWFVPATGTDTARIGVVTPHDFTKNPNFNLESFRVEHGPFDQGTVVCLEVVNELWAFYKAMSAMKVPASFTNLSSDADASPANNDFYGTSGSEFFGDGVDCSDPHNVTAPYPSGTPFTPDTDMLAVAAGHLTSGGTYTSVAATPMKYHIISIGQGGCTASVECIKAYIVVNAITFCRDISSASLSAYVYGQINSADDPPYAGACPTPSLEFTPGSTGWTYHTMANVAGGSISGTNDAYLGPIGEKSASWPSYVTCASPIMGNPPVGGGLGGAFAGRLTVIAKFSPVDD